MDLEGVSRDDLLEAAAELQLLQTAALQGETFLHQRPPTLPSSLPSHQASLVLTCDLSLLPKVRGVCPLQHAIDFCHSSPDNPALTAGTDCVAIQLNRFRTSGRVISKAAEAVSLPLHISLPSWVEGSARRLEYRLSAVLVHLGETPTQGHYRALLVERTGRMWWTDDGRKACSPTLADAKLIIHNSYVLFFRPSHETGSCSL